MIVKTTPAVVRVAARDRRIVTFTLDNTLDEPVSGSLQFDLPAGLVVEPEKAMFGPVQPRASATVGVTIVSNNPGPDGIRCPIASLTGLGTTARRSALRRCRSR